MIVEFSITPLGKGESLSEDVARVLNLVDKSGLDYRFTPMGTIVEGEWDEIMELIKRCHHLMLERANRVSTWIHIDDRKGVPRDRLRHKVKAVEERLGRELKK
ncbi:TPA: MTH1187 family thiamine-binding protein [Candidatus Bipolaricaulota bacterium]|nr:MTH1187 family thiamine-binding protein [Candidatus Bipolaricaulota bacterium]